MRIRIPLMGIFLVLNSVTCFAVEPAEQHQDAGGESKSIKGLLRRASELAAEQDEAQHYWTGHLLLQIVDVQMRAGDAEGVRQSIRSSNYPYGREASLVHFAEELAAAGKRQESLDVLNEIGSTRGERQDHRSDRVLLRWIEHLVALRDFKQAEQAVLQLQSKLYRPDGLRALAIGYAKLGEQAKASQHFKLALEATDDLEGFDRAQALWKTAEAQLAAGEAEAAKGTIRRLVAAADKMEPWPKVAALREAAVLSARLKDREAADTLFRQAIKSRQGIDDNNMVGALVQIAKAQARVGYIADSLKTAEMITHSESDFTQDGDREEALFAVAQAQLTADDPKGAVHTAFSITHYLQYRDESLEAVVDYHVQKGDLKNALAAAEMVHNPSQRASAILKTAIAHAKAGDKKLAAEVASRIKLTSASMFRRKEESGFDYRRPNTWGVNYDIGDGYTGLTHRLSIQRTAEVAKYAMTLAQTISLEPKPNYVELLNKYGSKETQALARAHAATGDAQEALAWAEQVGSDKKVGAKGDYEAVWALERRISALVGVAEGMLDRQAHGSNPPSRR